MQTLSSASLHVHRVGVGRGMHRDRGDAHLLARAVDAQRDLSAIGDEDLFEHRYSMIASTWPYSTGWASVTRICATRPARGAGIGLNVFIASTISSVWPSCT